MYYKIYKTTNIITGKFYIGKETSEDLDTKYLGSGVDLRKDIKLLGKENFIKEIILLCNGEGELSHEENRLVIVDPKISYNKVPGGFGGRSYIHETKEFLKNRIFTVDTILKMSLAKKESYNGKYNPFYGKTHKQSSLNLISESSKERGKRIYEDRMKDKNHPNNKIVKCPHCPKEGQQRAMYRWHFDNCKNKILEALF